MALLIFAFVQPFLQKNLKLSKIEDTRIISLILSYLIPVAILKSYDLQVIALGIMGTALGVLYYLTFKKMVLFRQTLKNRTILSEEELIAVTLTLCLLTAAFSYINIYTMNIGNVVSSYLVMLTGFTMGAGPAACLGIALGLSMGTKASISLALVGSLTVCALLSGVFRSFKKIGDYIWLPDR